MSGGTIADIVSKLNELKTYLEKRDKIASVHINVSIELYAINPNDVEYNDIQSAPDIAGFIYIESLPSFWQGKGKITYRLRMNW